MKKRLNILVKAPGSWTDGLNSYTRGEGRWALNISRSLALAGHNVYAWSGGTPDRHKHNNVTLLSPEEATHLTDIDIYIDGGMWEGEPVPVKAPLEICAFWRLEPRLQKPDGIPANRVIAYPYKEFESEFIRAENPHCESTFFLPTPFTWQDPTPVSSANNKRIFSTLRAPNYGLQDATFSHTWKQQKNITVSKETVEAYFKAAFANPEETKHFVIAQEPAISDLARLGLLRLGNTVTLYPPLSYAKTRELLRSSTINVPILSPSSVLDATFEGVPTVIFEAGGFFPESAISNGLLIEAEAPPERVREVMSKLMNETSVRTKYVHDLQESMAEHTHGRFLYWFNLICEKRNII